MSDTEIIAFVIIIILCVFWEKIILFGEKYMSDKLVIFYTACVILITPFLLIGWFRLLASFYCYVFPLAKECIK